MPHRLTTPSIPIQNIYYLLSYAWQKGELGTQHSLEGIPGDSPKDLLNRMLQEALKKIPQQVPTFRFYPVQTIYPGIKGKVDVARSLKHNLLPKGKTWVSYEQLHSDELYLQIARSTWEGLNPSTFLPPLLAPVSPIALSQSIFHQAQAQYPQPAIRYLLRICEWVYCDFLPSPTPGKNIGEGILLNPRVMPSLFESFVRNFLQRHAPGYAFIGRERLRWQEKEESEPSLLPKMETDVTLVSPSRKIVVETKYYREALQTHFRSEVPKFHSSHLYQLFAYLKHSGPTSEGNPCEGLLIYPTVNVSLLEFIELKGHPVRVCTLDLNRPWKEIQEELLGWVEK